MLTFFEGFDQGSRTPFNYKSDLRKHFSHFNKSKTSLSSTAKLLLVLRGLNDKYKPIINKFKDPTLRYNTTTMTGVTDW